MDKNVADVYKRKDSSVSGTAFVFTQPTDAL